jgi:hypothetical protein
MSFSKTFQTLLLLASLSVAGLALSGEQPAGRVVWWGQDSSPFRKGMYLPQTNGVLDNGDEILTNVVAIAAGWQQGLVLTSDGTVRAFGRDWFGGNSVPPGLSNVASIAVEGSACWAIRRDGTVARWGGEEEDPANVVASLSNVTAIAWPGYRGYLALKSDGALLGFRFESPSQQGVVPGGGNTNLVQPVRVRGQVLRDVAAVASMGDSPLILKRDGAVFKLGFQSPGSPSSEPQYRYRATNEDTIIVYTSGEVWNVPYQYTTIEPVLLNGVPLSNVTALATGHGHALALKRDGTVIAWGRDISGETQVPAGLSNVVAIAANEQTSLALKRNGTVVAWGANHFGQMSVPAGLSNVVCIATAGWFNLALTTGNVPANVHILPHGRLEEMALEADLIFKGQAISSVRVTNTAFTITQMDVHATTFKVISALKGELSTNIIVFQHYTKGPGAWGGGSPPPHHNFEPDQPYLVFAARADRPGKLYYDYSPSPHDVGKPDQFRQIGGPAILEDDGATRTLDDRPLGKLSIKEAHWVELNLLLNDTNPTNQLYALRRLDALSTNCATSWGHTEDFKRERVLKALAPLITTTNSEIAVAALGCFRFGPDCAAQIAPYSDALIQIASQPSSSARRVAAIAAFSRTALSTITNSLPKWLSDPADDVRARAGLLLSDFPGEPFERALRHAATDPSPMVRARVADAIGNGKITQLLPTLVVLFAETVSLTNPIATLTIDEVEEGGRSYEYNYFDVHISAGDALLKFDLDQVSDILKTNLNDAGFRLSFLCKLSEKDAGRWIKDMAEILDAWRLREKKKSVNWGANPETWQPPLSGTYFHCWKIIYQCLHDVPPAEFAEGKLDRILDVLEASGTSSSSEPRDLYELYRLKELNERATKYRSWCEKTFSYDIGYFFKQVDAQYTNSPAKHEP